MSERLPLFRADIAVSLHEEDGEQYIILNDAFGYAEGPIMVHADMMPILDACDGETTWDSFAIMMGLAPDSAGVLQARTFIGQLSQMGYFEDDVAETLRNSVDAAWDALDIRPTTCAGSSYPDTPDALNDFLNRLAPRLASELAPRLALGLLIPHIDFRVAPHVYGDALRLLMDTDADLYVIVGTSHYWGEHRVILTKKHFETPLGPVFVDRDLVGELEQRLRARETPGMVPILAPTDVAHKPEHSIELHTILLKYAAKGRPFAILPILVTGAGGEHDPEGAAVLAELAADLRHVVEASGKKTVWLISGDLAHVGARFGDDVPAKDMLADVVQADKELIGHLERADVTAYHGALEASGMRFRVCGHAPTLLALQAAQPRSGSVLAYDVWDDTETNSAVTFAAMAFSR